MIAPIHYSSPLKRPARDATESTGRADTLRKEALHDAALVQRFNSGNETAFVEIVTRHRERLFSVGYSMLGNHADAEEIAQDALIRAHRALAGFRGESSLATWLHRIALNLARNRYWYYSRRRRHATFSLDCAFSHDTNATFSDLVAANIADPARDAVAGEFSALVAACMEQLGAGHRQILTLRNSLNRSYGDIATELGISVGTVKSRIARAREYLRLLLAKACPEFGPNPRPEAWFEAVRPTGCVETDCV